MKITVIPNSTNIDLASRDMLLSQIETQINAKKQLLIDNQKQLKKISNENTFLKDILIDYYKYHNFIIQQKREQMQALELLNQYIKDLTTSGQLSQNNIKDARVEQRNILREMDYIKRDLDRLIAENSV